LGTEADGRSATATTTTGDGAWEIREKGRMVVSWRNIHAILKSLIRQSFSRYGFTYLRYIMRAVYRFPGEIVRIITFAIQGHHLFLITRRVLETSSAVQRTSAHDTLLLGMKDKP
jgi:hypothetical protein